MKRFVIFLSGLAVCYSLTGCSSSEVVDDIDTLSKNKARLEEIQTEMEEYFDSNESTMSREEFEELAKEEMYLQMEITEQETMNLEKEEINPVPHLK